jgi:FkbM family methyltransferase
MTSDIFALIFAGVLLVFYGIMIVLKKHRLIWDKIWSIEKAILDFKEENLALRKELCMLSIASYRLDLLMPSQHGEDIWLWYFFKKKKQGFFVEIGAYDGITFSNTYFFEAIGWKGIIVEPNPKIFNLCCKRRPNSVCINAAVTNGLENQTSLSLVDGDNGVDALSFTHPSGRHLDRVAKTKARIVDITVPALKLSKILEKVDELIDFISIDVEGAELDVLQSLDFDRHSPNVFIIEDNSFGHDTFIEEFLLTKGYKSKCRLGANILFVKNDDDSMTHNELSSFMLQ